MEAIDLNNVIEVEHIKRLIKDKPPLLNFFNDILLLANKQNREFDGTPVKIMPLEVYKEPNLSDHESDFEESE